MEEQRIGLTEAAKEYLRVTSGWAQFLAIIGFISVAFFILVGIAAYTVADVETLNPTDVKGLDFKMAGVFYVLYGCAVFFAAFYMSRFASKVVLALNNNDEGVLEESFGYLKSYYKYTGILVIATIVAYITLLFIVIAISM